MNRRKFLQQLTISGSFLSAALTDRVLAQRKNTKTAAKRVVIVGGGLAGLSAALELLNLGHNVTILEGQTRPGGRVYTLREPFSDGIYAEAGAFWIPASHFLTLGYARLFGLKTYSIDPRTIFSNYFFRKKNIRTTELVKNYEWLKLNSNERDVDIDGLQNKYLLKGLREIGDVTSLNWRADLFRKYDEITLAEYLKTQGASPDAIELIGLGLNLAGDGIHNCSALAMFREMTLSASPVYHKIIGGNDLLPKAFAQRMKGVINYGSRVIKIEHSQKEVSTTYLQGETERSIISDYLVCAIPFSVLKNIEIAPSFSEAKKLSIDNMSYTSVVRTFLQSRKKFWTGTGKVGYITTDEPIQFVGEATLFQTGNRGILESYTAGEKARKMRDLSPEQRIHFTLTNMKDIYPGIEQNFEGGFTKCWDEDKWARGAYAWFPPRYLSSSQMDISSPEGRIYFAGEHTSPWSGWMQGALESGTRAAQNINKRKD